MSAETVSKLIITDVHGESVSFGGPSVGDDVMPDAVLVIRDEGSTQMWEMTSSDVEYLIDFINENL